jgi:isobutyryl-CoA mutase
MALRGKIQEELMCCSVFDQGRKKRDGSLSLIGVDNFLCASSAGDHGGEVATGIEMIRSTEEKKGQRIANVKRYGEARNALASDSLKVLQQTARDRRNVFEQLIEAVKYNSLGQISHALYDVGGVSEEYVIRAPTQK